MKFKPFPHRLRRLDFNQRKASLFERKQQREANALPLFAEMIRAELKWTHRSRQFFSEFKLRRLLPLQLVG
ncbi:hypothetical protein OLN11_32635, partial [Pseudomonas aeruginosa]